MSKGELRITIPKINLLSVIPKVPPTNQIPSSLVGLFTSQVASHFLFVDFTGQSVLALCHHGIRTTSPQAMGWAAGAS